MNKDNKPPRFPKEVTERRDQKGDLLGVTSAPGALLKVDLGLTIYEFALCQGLFEHYRRAGDMVFVSYVRIAIMVGGDRKAIGRAAEALHRRGLVPRKKRGRGYIHDLKPLLAAMASAPLKEFPDFKDDLAQAQEENARLRAENAALKKLTAPTEAPVRVQQQVEFNFGNVFGSTLRATA